MLLDECRMASVRIEAGCEVASVQQASRGFTLMTTLGPIEAEAVVVATGGLSIPKMGATGFGYDLARRFGHTIVPTRAALVPLTLSRPELGRYSDLSGVGLPVEASCNGARFAGGMLFTHRGLSGPPMLQLSSYWRPGHALSVDLLPDHDLLDWLLDRQRAAPAAALSTVLADRLPKRLAARLCDLEFGGRPIRQYREADLRDIAHRLHSWTFSPAGTEGYRTAEVTSGGVSTDELSSVTMASKKVPNLYFIGEVVDVTGHLGGFNFQWAWASGHAAGQAV
jgi:predicted Rossmann fold flavoprotein